MTLYARCILLAWEDAQARYRRAARGERTKALWRLQSVTKELMQAQGRRV